MRIQKKFWLGIAGLLMTSAAAYAQVSAPAPVAAPVPAQNDYDSEDEAVLFKIHDVTPVKNKENGSVVSCDFYITFYNRSHKDINGALLDLSWLDNSLADVINEEKEISAEKNRHGEDIDPEFSYTQRNNPVELMVSVDMPAIKSFKQITVRSSLKSDRCFVLLRDLSLNVRSCSTKNDSPQMIGNAAGCNGLFRFVSQNNPEYYMEFKKVSYNEQKIAERKQRANQEKEMEEQYKKAVQSFDVLTQTLSEIR